MKVLDQIKDMLCDELEDVVKKKDLTSSSLDFMDTAVDIIKDIDTIEVMRQEYGQPEGYSQGYFGRMPYYVYDDMPMARDGRSYARGSSAPRDSRGRYMSDGYSGDTKEELQRLLDTAKNDHEREAIRHALENIR